MNAREIMVAINKTRALADIDSMINSLNELKQYVKEL